MAANWANHNRNVTEGLQALLQEYDEGGGSGVYDMATLRATFANWIPFEHEHFLRHFSIFATEAVALDLRANRFCYPIGGIPPDPSVPIKDSPPYIQPTQLLQNVEQIGRPRRNGPEEAGNGNGVDRRQDTNREEGEGRNQNEGERGENRIQEEGSRRGEEDRRRKRNTQDREDDSSSDEFQNESSKSKNNHVWSFIKNKKPEEHPLSQEAIDINKAIKEYRDNNLFNAVFNFVWYSGKSHNFPDALVQDLLQYKFIDLEKINAGPTTQNFSLASRSKDTDPAAKIKPKPFTEATEWRDAISYLVDTLSLAFGNWRDVIPYDIALRQAFATRRHLSFADFASDELSHLKHLALADRKQHKESHSQPRSSNYTQSQSSRIPSSRSRPEKKPRVDHPWAGKVKDTRNLPQNQQLCGGWNLNKCLSEKCPSGRVHNMCDYVDCYESHKRISHSA
ncbi:uncharacterized protein MELLADRAFT_95981 [Melampsora larici-populina 98AG31]|uniref:Uncharacterized protein n=1 Tax=Melampsora larici-populina (strain 98AG31 / pathotype 3-4-7) TaxID=747676 RepID=F4RDZ3_MELLP|nr:uncharacterized protein MELLADRAFT_95981 [Melampsora larici-populina 98AG31]EGG09490.1 hypothetical protein MELLADRAFT_95981 [Melampsora larici-populina 98AG31]